MPEFEKLNEPRVVGHDFIKGVPVHNEESLANIKTPGEGDFSRILHSVVGVMVAENPYHLSTEGFLSEPIYDLFVGCRQLCTRAIDDIPVENNRALLWQDF
jgi:hypothetical protein